MHNVTPKKGLIPSKRNKIHGVDDSVLVPTPLGFGEITHLFPIFELLIMVFSTGHERTPLLLSGRPEPSKPTPIPWAQFSIVLVIQLAEPLTYTVMYPFAPQVSAFYQNGKAPRQHDLYLAHQRYRYHPRK